MAAAYSDLLLWNALRGRETRLRFTCRVTELFLVQHVKWTLSSSVPTTPHYSPEPWKECTVGSARHVWTKSLLWVTGSGLKSGFSDAKSRHRGTNGTVHCLWSLVQRVYCERTLAQRLEPGGPLSFLHSCDLTQTWPDTQIVSVDKSLFFASLLERVIIKKWKNKTTKLQLSK